MTFLPIVDRELRVSARKTRMYWGRSLVVLAALVIGVFVYLASWGAPAYSFGQYLFHVLAGLSFVYCLGVGIFSTSDCLSEEKREGTLGLLFLTDLKGYDVVLGKVAATSLRGFFALLAIFPILALSLLTGGVTKGEFARVTMILANTYLFSVAIGVLVSAMSENSRKAALRTGAIVLAFTVLLPAFTVLLAYWSPNRKSRLAEALVLPCPFVSFISAFDGTYRGVNGPKTFWIGAGTIHGLMWVMLTLASFILPRNWQDKPDKAHVKRWREIWHEWTYGSRVLRKSFRSRLLDVNAIYWLTSRAWLKPAKVWLWVGVGAGFWAWTWFHLRSDWFNEAIYFPMAMVLNSLLKLWVAGEVGQQLGQDRKSGALELLLSTPMTVKDILRGQFLGLRRLFFWPITMAVGMQVIFMFASLQYQSFGQNPRNPLMWLALISMLLLDVLAIIWVGMGIALRSKKPTRIAAPTVARLLVAPWVFYVAVIIIVELVDDLTGWSSSSLTWKFYCGLWFGLGVATDLAFGLTARWQVRSRFREFVLERFTPTESRIMRLLARFRRPAKSVEPAIIPSLRG